MDYLNSSLTNSQQEAMCRHTRITVTLVPGRPQVPHLYVTLPMAVSSTSHYSCVCFPCWWDLWFMPFPAGAWRHWQRRGTQRSWRHTTFYCANGLRTPHSLHILRSWFHFSSGIRAGLPPLSPDASCSVAVSLSPRGATRLGGGYCPHPPAHLQRTVLQDLSACRCGAPFPAPSPPLFECWGGRPGALALIALLVPARPACSAGAEFI